jgi:hypothetical protein
LRKKDIEYTKIAIEEEKKSTPEFDAWVHPKVGVVIGNVRGTLY